MTQVSHDSVAALAQVKFFRRAYSGQLQAADSRKLDNDGTLANVLPLTKAIISSASDMFYPGFHDKVKAALHVLEPASSTEECGRDL